MKVVQASGTEEEISGRMVGSRMSVFIGRIEKMIAGVMKS
jgi:hypothetical protein